MISDSLQAAIAAGHTRTICPACHGGDSREQSLSIRHDSPLISLYCYRNKCGWRHTLSSGDAVPMPRGREPRAYDADSWPIDGAMGELLDRRYELAYSDYGPRWRIAAEGTLLMAVWSPHGQLRGHASRTFTKPKRCMSYQAVLAQPWLDWWLPDEARGRLYLVEDQISACKIASIGTAAVALLGTQLSPAKAAEIAAVSSARKLTPVLALDPDATQTAFNLQARYQHVLRHLAVMPMADDPKDIPRDILRIAL